MEHLRFVDACTEEHFAAMSRIHALGWRDTYAEAVPADYMARRSPSARSPAKRASRQAGWRKPVSMRTARSVPLMR